MTSTCRLRLWSNTKRAWRRTRARSSCRQRRAPLLPLCKPLKPRAGPELCWRKTSWSLIDHKLSALASALAAATARESPLLLAATRERQRLHLRPAALSAKAQPAERCLWLGSVGQLVKAAKVPNDAPSVLR
mmetsp:Transcript_90853/g.157697  ORF Transcript_90853/g.157697 Transcript_90853/m.157697 type:complete len:132 (-) Transcript_90853:224-619(-)